jgi:protein SCO1/2
VNQDGEKISLTSLLNGEKPVFLDFIYATCTTICPILSVGFSYFQKKMGPEADKVQLVSISIDPDNDTPEIMTEYLQKYKSQPGWEFLTGKRQDIIQVMKAFDAYVVNKMNHYPMTILRAPGSDEWVRIDGLLGASDLMEEYRQLAGK